MPGRSNEVTYIFFGGNQQTMKNPNISSVASETVKIEFSLIANSMIEMVDARLADDVSLLYRGTDV